MHTHLCEFIATCVLICIRLLRGIHRICWRLSKSSRFTCQRRVDNLVENEIMIQLLSWNMVKLKLSLGMLQIKLHCLTNVQVMLLEEKRFLLGWKVLVKAHTFQAFLWYFIYFPIWTFSTDSRFLFIHYYIFISLYCIFLVTGSIRKQENDHIYVCVIHVFTECTS